MCSGRYVVHTPAMPKHKRVVAHRRTSAGSENASAISRNGTLAELRRGGATRAISGMASALSAAPA